MFSDSGLSDKVVLVTGGSRGIGRAITELLAQEKAKVHFVYRNNVKAAEEVKTFAKQNNLSINAYQADVCAKDQIADVVKKIIDTDGRIDVLVNNSGIVRDGLLMSLSDDDIKDVIDTNLIGMMQVIQEVIPHMMSQRFGKIINISSVSAEKGGQGQANYAASKGAINAMTKSLAVELAKRNITVNAVAPGVIETDISEEVRNLAGQEILTKILAKRYGRAEEVAYLVVFLASKYADYINGEILHIDGGFKMN
ncbi:MAG: 3-oxoacyl-ACP reductase family protein [Gammaproteobacteria bacterium]